MDFDNIFISWFKKVDQMSHETQRNIFNLIAHEYGAASVKILEFTELKEINMEVKYRFKAESEGTFNKMKEKILKATNYDDICLECFKSNNIDDSCGKCKKRKVIIT